MSTISPFLSVAKGSVGEIQSLLYVAPDNEFIEQGVFGELYRMCDAVGSLVGGFMNYLRKSKRGGPKFKRVTPEPRETCAS